MNKEAYARGFCKAAQTHGVEPVALAKFAAISEEDVEKAKGTVADFNNRIVIPTKHEYAGEPDKDWNTSGYTTGFPMDVRLFKDEDAPRSLVERLLPIPGLNGSTAGYVSTRDSRPVLHLNKDVLSPENVSSTMAHEMAHEQNKDVDRRSAWRKAIDRRKGVVPLSGRSGIEDKKLDAAYRFDKNSISSINAHNVPDETVKAEQGTTNREYRFGIYNDLTKKLGRPPTYEEFKQFVRDMSLDDIFRRYRKYPNAYVSRTEDHRSFAESPFFRGEEFPAVSDLQRRSFEDMNNTWERWGRIKAPNIYEGKKRYEEALENNKEWLEAMRRAWLEVAKNRMPARTLNMV